MERFDWTRAKEYWQTQRDRAGRVDRVEDPDALGNVCHAGAPIWLNQYYARYQRQVFEELLARCPAAPGARALDVGCGAGRWCRLLAERGYRVHGIDLQPSLIEDNRRRYPHMSFDCVPVQEFAPDAPFDLVTTVTVIQHLPFDEQATAIRKIAALVKPAGHVLSLENIADQGIHVFANSIDEWRRAFESAGLELLALRRYDYSPALRASGCLARAGVGLARRAGVVRRREGPDLPRAAPAAGGDGSGEAGGSGLGAALRRMAWRARRVATAVDDRREPLRIRLNPRLPTVHCGFLFRKRP